VNPPTRDGARPARAAGHLTGLVLLAAAVAAPRSWALTITRGPLIQNPDALTSTMTMEWWTDAAGDSTVEYGPTPALGFTATVPQAGSCEVGSAGTCHIVPLSGLFPGTRYYYRLRTNGVVVQDTGPTGPYFTTLREPIDPTDLFFTVIGDWGGGTTEEQQVANLVPRSNIPVTATFVLDSPAGQCGAATFPGPPPAPSCRFNTTGSTLSCK